MQVGVVFAIVYEVAILLGALIIKAKRRLCSAESSRSAD